MASTSGTRSAGGFVGYLHVLSGVQEAQRVSQACARGPTVSTGKGRFFTEHD